MSRVGQEAEPGVCITPSLSVDLLWRAEILTPILLKTGHKSEKCGVTHLRYGMRLIKGRLEKGLLPKPRKLVEWV